MKIKQLIDEDFVNYKKPSMFIGFPQCDFKCERECGMRVCQNSILVTSQTIDIGVNDIISRYINNPITSAIVMGGLEPFDTFWDLLFFIRYLRTDWECNDDIVIYTGYNKEEVLENINLFLLRYPNIYIKFGRYIPNQKLHYDDILGVSLASDNQYAEKIS